MADGRWQQNEFFILQSPFCILRRRHQAQPELQ
jgi:hypothetical protein